MALASNAMEEALLKLILNNVTWANVGDATGIRESSADGNLYISLHTADPGEAGNQTTSEATYTGYARKAVTRDGTGWTVASDGTGVASNAGAITFDPCTAGANTITHFMIGSASSGTGINLLRGTCSLSVSVGITPSFAIGALTVTCA